MLGVKISLAIKRFHSNINSVVRYLRVLNKDYIIQIKDFNLLLKLIPKIYYLSPWMWNHRCLYESLILYFFYPDAILNIGFKILSQKTKTGHCWITVNGAAVNKKDTCDSHHYKVFFNRYQNIIYWLPDTYQAVEMSFKIKKNDYKINGDK
jgi:hypothetical protein